MDLFEDFLKEFNELATKPQSYDLFITPGSKFESDMNQLLQDALKEAQNGK